MNRTEPVELTNMCMVYRGDELLVQNRFHKDWHGVIFPGGHVEPGEMFSESVIREIKEETGLTIFEPKLCGIKQFKGSHGRYVVFLYKTDKFEGDIKSSDEGEVYWVKRSEVHKQELVSHFFEMLEVFDNDNISEIFYLNGNDVILK